MEMTGKQKQRLFQISVGVLLILLAFFVEMVVIEPQGIYSYSDSGAGLRTIKIGLSKETLLKKINRIKSIRSVRTCNPDTELTLSSRRSFDLGPKLKAADIWICKNRKSGQYLFQFKGDSLVRILYLNLSYKDMGAFALFTQCDPKIHGDMDTYLAQQTRFSVLYE